ALAVSGLLRDFGLASTRRAEYDPLPAAAADRHNPFSPGRWPDSVEVEVRLHLLEDIFTTRRERGPHPIGALWAPARRAAEWVDVRDISGATKGTVTR